MMFRKEMVLRIGAVEGEYRIAALAVADLLRRAQVDVDVLGPATPAEARACLRNLEATYLVRMFAVFEAGLREVREIVYRRTGAVRTANLIDQCAARQHIEHDHLENVHRVREYRNTIVHGGNAPNVPLPEARKWLCIFFGWMPPQW